METSHTAVADAGAVSGSPMPSVWERAVAVFVRPSAAWDGLRERSQWWFPVVLMMLLNGGIAGLLHQRAIMPMITERWEEAVDSGQMTSAQLDKMEQWMSSPAGIAVGAVQQAVIFPILLLLSALGTWFGVGFVLGNRDFRYRHAFEVTVWSSLVLIPAQLLTAVLAWIKETMKGIHVGFGILLPEADVPSKLQTGLGAFLDTLGPLSIWCLVVTILGAAALSGAPRKNVAWVLGGLYLVLGILMSAIAAMFTPGS